MTGLNEQALTALLERDPARGWRAFIDECTGPPRRPQRAGAARAADEGTRSMTHLNSQELRDWRAGHLDHDRARIVAHLAACGICAAQLSNMARYSPTVDEAADLTSDELEVFRRAGYAAGATLERSAQWSWQSLAAAAVLALAVGATTSYYLGTTGDRISRGTGAETVVLRAPVGVVNRDDLTSFEWNGTTGTVRLVVIDLSAPGKPVIDRRMGGLDTTWARRIASG